MRITFRRFAVYKGVAPHFVYFMFGEEMLQYKFTKHLYSAKSPYQQIDIYDSEELGAVLFLDYDTSELMGNNRNYSIQVGMI